MPSVLIIPDLHAPYQHPDALDFLKRLKRHYKPAAVICIGDEIDAHALSRYPHDPDLAGAEDEACQADAFLQSLFTMFPVVRCCTSNHTYRAYRAAYAAGINSRWLKSIGDALHAPAGWQWGDRWEVDNVTYIHGEGFSGLTPQLAAADRLRRNVVLGHTHTAAGAVYSYGIDGPLWGLAVGCLIDDTARAFAYAKYQGRRPALGAGVIVNGVPHFEPLS